MSASRLVYYDSHLGTLKLARELDIPYVLMLGYDLLAESLVASDGILMSWRPGARSPRVTLLLKGNLGYATSREHSF
jgi:hypothetical protein